MKELWACPHVVEVNLLGITGIVVERFLCRDVKRSSDSPSPHESMKALVVVVGHQQQHLSGSTTFGVSSLSIALRRSPGKVGISARVGGKHRFLALLKGDG